MICSTEGCDKEMDALNVKHDADPAFFNSAPVEWGLAWVCRKCTPKTHRRFRNA